DSASAKPQTVNEMHAFTARHDCNIPMYQSAPAAFAVWLGVVSVRETIGVWLLSVVSTNVRTSASVIATFRPRLANDCRSWVMSTGLNPNCRSRWPWSPTQSIGTFWARRLLTNARAALDLALLPSSPAML